MSEPPRPVFYIPSGWSRHNVPPAEISVEDLEAFRLVDGEGCNLDEAAHRMQCSRSTIGRILERARRILAQALAEARIEPLLLHGLSLKEFQAAYLEI